MAAIDTLAGVTLLTGSVNTYLITAQVDVPSNIDDLDGATFIVQTSAIFRYAAGCDTIFNRCIVYENSDCASLGTDNFSNPPATATSPRWNGGVTCAPIHKGCQFIMEPVVARSDFDIGIDASPQFIRDDYGTPTRIWLQQPPSYSEQADHFASENMTIDGCIYESYKDDSSIEFRIPPNIQSLTLDQNAKVETVIFLMNLWAGSSTYAVSGLGSNYVGTFQGDATKTLQLNDPLGTPLKGHASYADPAFWRGVLEVYRNYSLNVIDAVSQAVLNPRIVITADSNDAVRYDEDLVGGIFSERLYEWGAGFEITTPTYDADYRRGLGLWGYTPSVKSFTANDDPTTMADGTILFFVDAGVTAASQAIVDAYTELETDEKLYDAIQREQLVRTDRENFVDTIADSAGTAIDFQGNTVVLTNAAPSGYPLEYTDPTITAYTDGNAFTLNKFNQLVTTAGIVFSQSEMMPDNITISGDAALLEVTDLNGVTVTQDLIMATAGTYDFTGCTIFDVINTSGGAITIEADAGTTISNNTGPNITIIAPTITFDITVDVTAQIIIFASGTQTEIDSATATSLSYEYTGTPIYDVTIYVAGKILFRQTVIQMSASGSALNVTLSNDLLYDAGHGLVWQTDLDYDRTTLEFSALTSQTGPDFYSAMIDAYINETYLRNTAFDMEPFGNAGMLFNNGMEFIDTASQNNWRRMGVSYVVGGVSLYEAVAIYTLTGSVPAGAQAKFQQEDGLNTQLAINTGAIDQLIQVYGDLTHGDFDYRDWGTVKYQENTYREIYVNILDLYAIAEFSPIAYPISTPFTAVDIVAGDPAISITIVDHTGAPISVGGVLFDYEIVDNGTNSGLDIEREIRYNISQGGSYQGELAYNWFADMVSQLGSGYETQAGVIQGLAGTHGFYVSRGGDDHPDFLRFQGNDESYYVPPTTAGVSANNVTAGQVWLYNETRAATIEVTTVTSGYSRLWIDGTDADAGDTIILYWIGIEENLITNTFSATADSVVNVLDVPSTDISYAAYGVDGSTVTEFTFDNGNIEIDIDVGVFWQPQRIYARYKYVMATDPAAMTLFVGGLRSDDPSLILIVTAIADIFLDNVNPTSIRQSGDIVFKRDDGVFPQANPTSGGGGIGIYFEGIGYTYSTGDGPLTPAQEAQLSNASTQSQTAAENTEEIKGSGFVEIDNSLVAITADIEATATQLSLDALQVTVDTKSSQVSVDALQTSVDAVPDSAENADRLLGRAIQGGADGGRTVTQSYRANRNRLDMVTGLVYEEDDITVSHAYNVTRADVDAIVQMDPT